MTPAHRRRRDREADAALGRFYASACRQFGPLRGLLLLAYVTQCGRRAEARRLVCAGVPKVEVARRLGVQPRTITKWTTARAPRLSAWAERELSAVRERSYAELCGELAEPWEAAS